MSRRLPRPVFVVAFALAALWATAVAAERDVALTVLVPVEMKETGFIDDLTKRFTKSARMKVKVIAGEIGTIQKLVEKGGGDVVFADSRAFAEQLRDAGHVTALKDVFYGERVVVGPKPDPARIAGMASVIEAFARIAGTQESFLSRGDDSALHQTEMAIWQEAGFDPEVGARKWYRKTHKKTSLTLRIAAIEFAYTLAGRSSWLRFGDPARLAVHVDGDPRLQVQTVVMRLNPRKHRKVQTAPARAFIKWLKSADARKVISEFTIKGETVYYLPQDGG